MAINTKLTMFLSTLSTLETTIKNKDTYWFPTWTINTILNQLGNDLDNLKTDNIEKTDLDIIKGRFTLIKGNPLFNKDIKQESTRIWSIFSCLFPKVLTQVNSEKITFILTKLSTPEAQSQPTRPMAAHTFTSSSNSPSSTKIAKNQGIINSNPALPNWYEAEFEDDDKRAIKAAYGDLLIPCLEFLSKKFPALKNHHFIKLAIPFIEKGMTQEDISSIIKQIHDIPYYTAGSSTILLTCLPELRDHLCSATMPLIKPGMSATEIITILDGVAHVPFDCYIKNTKGKYKEKIAEDKNLLESCRAANSLIKTTMETKTITKILKEFAAIPGQEAKERICANVSAFIANNPQYSETHIPNMIKQEWQKEEDPKTDSESGSDSETEFDSEKTTKAQYSKSFDTMHSKDKVVEALIKKAKSVMKGGDPTLLFDSPKNLKGLKANYLKISRLIHPDKIDSKLSKEAATELFTFVRNTYEQLEPQFNKGNKR